MKVTCEYCNNTYEDDNTNCPHCGAPNKFVRTADGTPQTIEDLKQWYIKHNLPPEEVTRYFIGKDIREPKAFGIYYNGSEYVVYKNKADGSRAIRYQGTDQRYAVNELYQRLKSDIANQKSNQRLKNNSSVTSSYSNMRQFEENINTDDGFEPNYSFLIGIIAVLVITILVCCYFGKNVPTSDTYNNSSQHNSSNSSYYNSNGYSGSSNNNGWRSDNYSNNSKSFHFWNDDDDDDDDDWWDDWDNDYDWDSDDSWDSDYGDWDSDW